MPGRRRRPATIAVSLLLVTLMVDVAKAAPPSNDNFDDRATVAAVPYTDVQDTTDATTESAEQQPQSGDCLDAGVGATVWYQYTAPASVALEAGTVGSTYDTTLAVWTGTTLGSLTEVACNDDAVGLDSRVTFSATAGTTYLVQVGGFEGDAGVLRFELAPAAPLGGISGTVRADGGGPIGGICVDVYDASTGMWVDWTMTDPSGAYVVDGLVAGSYVVGFSDWCDESTDFLEEYFDDRPTFDSADAVVVTPPNATTGIDAVLSPGAFVSGRVVDANSRAPLPEVCVNAYDPTTDGFGFAVTGTDGRYRLGGLPSGQYRIGFFHCAGDEPRYREEWYDNKQYDDADPVRLTVPGGVGGIDAALIPNSGPASKQVFLRVRPRRPDRGDRIRLAVRILPCGGEPGDVVEFFRGKRRIGKETTDRACRATETIRVRRSGTFRAVSPADGDLLAGSSKAVRIKVRGA